MIQFFIFILSALFFVAIFFANNEALSKKNKIILFLVLGHLIGFGWLYEFHNAEQRNNNREMLSAFKQGKSLTCKEVEVNKEHFIYVSGTLSFIPTDANEAQKGLVLDIATCKLK